MYHYHVIKKLVNWNRSEPGGNVVMRLTNYLDILSCTPTDISVFLKVEANCRGI